MVRGLLELGPMSHRKQHSAETLRRRRLLSYTWAGLVVGWSLIRALIVWAAVGDYGLNPWIYLAIDLSCAIVDGFTTPRMVLAFIDDYYRRALKWGALSLIAFVIPDVYIFLGTRELPKRIILMIVAIITCTFSFAVWTVVKKIRKGKAERRARLEAEHDGIVPATAHAEPQT